MNPAIETIIKSLIAVAWMDGRMAEEEKNVVDAIIASFQLSVQEQHVLREYALIPRSLDDIPLTELSFEQKRELLQQAVVITYVDGSQSDEEREVIAELVNRLAMPKADAQEVITAAKARAKRMLELL